MPTWLNPADTALAGSIGAPRASPTFVTQLPYQGHSDGLASQLRKRHSEASYVGIELEGNQHFVLQGGAI